MNNIIGLYFTESHDRKAIIWRSIKKYSEYLKDTEMEFINIFLSMILDHCSKATNGMSDNKLHEKKTLYYIKKVCWYAEDIFRLFYDAEMSGTGYSQFFLASNVHESPAKLIVNYLESEMKEINNITWNQMREKDSIMQSIVLLAHNDTGLSINKAISALRDAVTNEEVRELERIMYGYNLDNKEPIGIKNMDRIEELGLTEDESIKKLLDMRDTIIPGVTSNNKVLDGEISVQLDLHKNRDHKELLVKLVSEHLCDSKWIELWRKTAGDPNLHSTACVSCNYNIAEKIAEEIQKDLEKLGELLYELTASVYISYPPGGFDGIAAYDDHGGFFTVSMDKGGHVFTNDTPII